MGKNVITLIAALLVAGCVSAPAKQAIPPGTIMAPPGGFIEHCIKEPTAPECSKP